MTNHLSMVILMQLQEEYDTLNEELNLKLPKKLTAGGAAKLLKKKNEGDHWDILRRVAAKYIEYSDFYEATRV